MAKNYIQDGKTINFTAKKNLQSGQVAVLETLVAIAITDVKANETGTGIVGGVWELPAKTADDIKQGAVVYWSDSDNQATITKGSNPKLGIAWADSGTSDSTVRVKINA
ncbi:DUF2190 family protein [Pasteurella atlantica]|uniref:DUF2190 family protein n=2 Tax=Pasteurellaceae TaxID=712 RepID=A0ACC6HJP3_9PAST|nr:capsid cement protein [Pasteurella atlantica]MDP8051048.1 DUF2190 family protein [Pasteurella atlantica]MDP8104344.1 DUF2190 family protein [Pasteurella atlantica]MDP8147704.1 DUF2190 family protein [Pasteurella atlantica]